MSVPQWASDLFQRQSSSKAGNTWTPNWSNAKSLSEQQQNALDFDYFDVEDGELETREIKSNKNLLNPKEFAKYWQTGKHKGYTIYQGKDMDGDDLPDMFAVNPSNQVVGFNDRYIVEGKDAETPYRRAYYALDKDKRKNISYQQFLAQQQNIPGWKNLDKFKASRLKKRFL